jgi:hypothetical protein
VLKELARAGAVAIQHLVKRFSRVALDFAS